MLHQAAAGGMVMLAAGLLCLWAPLGSWPKPMPRFAGVWLLQAVDADGAQTQQVMLLKVRVCQLGVMHPMNHCIVIATRNLVRSAEMPLTSENFV